MAQGSIVKRGNAYYIVYRFGGKQKWERIGLSRRDAEEVLVERMNEINKGAYREPKRISFADFADKWFEDCASVRSMFKRAVIWGYIHESPAQFVERPKVEDKDMDFLTPEEVELFLDNVTPRFRPLFMTAVMTGLRRGVTMSPELARCLKKHKIACPPSKDDLVFCTEVDTPLDADNLIHREFLPALRRAGLRKIRLHDLRHTFTSLLIATGENVKYIQYQLGHASIQTTLDRYGHLMPESHREAGKRLDEFVFGEASSQRKAEAIAVVAGGEKCDFFPKMRVLN